MNWFSARGFPESFISGLCHSSPQKISESRYWTKEEREKFYVALKMFGTDFEAIAAFVGTRNSTQVRTHAQKYYAKMVRDYKKNGKASQTQNKGQKSSSNN